MIITVLATLTLMAAYFLILYGGVAFIQDKRFFGSAHKDILAVIPDRKERFKGAHTIGWIIIIFAFLMYPAAFILGGWEGVKNGFGFLQFFIRFIIMLYGMETFDIIFFDWVLLCNSNFFPRYYPEVKGIVGRHMFGYNKWAHVIHYLVYIPVCALIAWICTLF